MAGEKKSPLERFCDCLKREDFNTAAAPATKQPGDAEKSLVKIFTSN
jgi:hypothetical protein